MNSCFFGKLVRLTVIGACLLLSSSCVEINEHLGQNFIPDNQKWSVYVPASEQLEMGDVVMQMSDSLSAYSNRRFTFGGIKDDLGTTSNSTCFTLVPIKKDISFGKNWKVKSFHFAAIRDTFSVRNTSDKAILQNVYIHPLKKQLDTTVLYTGEFMKPERIDEFVNFDETISIGTPVYDGGDSLSFDFKKSYAEEVIRKIEGIESDKRDSIRHYLKALPGIYIGSDTPYKDGGRINMFEIALSTDKYGYVLGNYAELKLTADYGDRKDVDTTFLFMFGPSDFISDNNASMPKQFAYNASIVEHTATYASIEHIADEKIFIEGGSGLKPVIKASGIKNTIENIIRKELDAPTMTDFSNIVINRATISFSYDETILGNGWDDIEHYPAILSPTVRLRSTKGNHVTYAGLTDSSIESANKGDINRSRKSYDPDVSHHIQEILKLDRNDKDFEKNIEKYNIWMLIMHEEVTVTTSQNSNSDLMNNLLYNSYYNNMMYDPYGYGGYYGGYYGGGYGNYGYNNYYNYLMMAQYASGNTSSSTQTSTDLDKDRYYRCVLFGPGETVPAEKRPQIKITFSVPAANE